MLPVRRALSVLHRRALFPLLSILLPADCFACSRPLGPSQLLGACPRCWSRLRPIRPPECQTCGVPLPSGSDLLGPAGGRCAPCLLRPPAWESARAAVLYDRVARSFLLRAKFGGRPEILRALGGQLARVLEVSGFAASCAAVVAVPSHPWVRWRRGFDPAIEIAKPVARRLGLPLTRGAVARRLRRPFPAKRLGVRDRRRLLTGAFRPLRRLPAKRVLLVDDVLTTGSTAEACAEALRQAGVPAVRLAVWARTPWVGRRGGV